MASMGGYGQTVRYGGFGSRNTMRPKTTAQAYTPPETVTPTGIASQMDYLKNIPTGYTPEQELAMRNRIRSTDTAQQAGGVNRLREMLAAQGLGGSGAETSKVGDLIRGQNAARQGALSNLDINNATLNLQNQYAKAGMMNQLTGMGEGARQFDQGQSSNMYQYGTSFDEDKRRYDQQRMDYQKQLEDWLRKMNLR